MRIREVGQKAENLIEQAEQAKQQQVYYQQAAANARSQMMAAYAMIDAASETDEDGNPRGDPTAARAMLYAAQAQLASAERGIADAARRLEGINRDKQDTIGEIERYTDGQRSNYAKLQELQTKRFGGNANAFIADLAARMNMGEAARDRLLQSLGQSPAGVRFNPIAAGGQSIHVGSSSKAQARIRDNAQEVPYGSDYFSVKNMSRMEHAQYEYLWRVNAIFNHPHMSAQQKREALVAERARAQSEFASIREETEGVPVKILKPGGSSGTKLINKQERYDELHSEYNADIQKILNDNSWSDAQKQILINELNQQYFDTLKSEGLVSEQNPLGSGGGIFSFFGGSKIDVTQYRGIEEPIIQKAGITKVPAAVGNTAEMKERICNHPKFAGMVECNNRQGYVFCMNDSRLNNLAYSQGDNSFGMSETCGLKQSVNVINAAGQYMTEDGMVRVAWEDGLCDSAGRATPGQIAALLSDNGVPAHYDFGLNAQEIANLLENGHKVILGINAGYLWDSIEHQQTGAANHAISVIGTVRDRYTLEVIGFFINDTGRGRLEDQKRLISISKFKQIYEVPGSAVIATDNPIQ